MIQEDFEKEFVEIAKAVVDLEPLDAARTAAKMGFRLALAKANQQEEENRALQRIINKLEDGNT